MSIFTPAERAGLAAARAVDLLNAMLESLGPQCETVSADGVRCLLHLNHGGECDVRPWRRPR